MSHDSITVSYLLGFSKFYEFIFENSGKNFDVIIPNKSVVFKFQFLVAWAGAGGGCSLAAPALVVLLSAANLVYWCCVFCEENIAIRNEIFYYVIIVMVRIFRLFHVVTAVYNGGSCFYFENFQHCT
jgi:hypothetical protein